MRKSTQKPYILPLAIVASLALSLIIVAMITDRVAILRDGGEVVLKVEPIDPRDLLRGRYVQLAYEARRVPVKNPQTRRTLSDNDGYGTAVFVIFEMGPDGHHVPVDLALEKPEDGIFMAAISRGAATVSTGRLEAIDVDYGMGRFYTNEQRAPLLEQRMRAGDITTVVAAVDASGRPQIKALRQGDDVIVTEPLY